MTKNGNNVCSLTLRDLVKIFSRGGGVWCSVCFLRFWQFKRREMVTLLIFGDTKVLVISVGILLAGALICLIWRKSRAKSDPVHARIKIISAEKILVQKLCKRNYIQNKLPGPKLIHGERLV